MFKIKPRRTLESVVDELISGLRSGEVVIPRDRQNKSASLVSDVTTKDIVPSKAMPVQAWDFSYLPHHSEQVNLGHQQAMILFVTKRLTSGYGGIATVEEVQREMSDRFWLIVCDFGEIETRILSLALSHAASNREDVRILLTPRSSKVHYRGLEERGMRNYVRTIDSDVNELAMVALTGETIFWQALEPKAYDRPQKQFLDQLQRLETSSVIRHFEQLFELLWKEANRR
jgi:hypothetical protein